MGEAINAIAAERQHSSLDSMSAPSSLVRLRIAVVHNCDFLEYAERAPSYEADAEISAIAETVAGVLRSRGHEVSIIGVSDRLDALTRTLERERFDRVFNLVESLGGDASRETELPALLDSLAIPYTGNRARALDVAHKKDETRRVLKDAGVPIPRGVAIDRALFGSALEAALAGAGLSAPFFVKPARTDASIGIDQASVAKTVDALEARLRQLEAAPIAGPYLVESYLPGKEVNVAIFPEPIDGHFVCTEIDFSEFGPDQAPIVTYDCKWRPGTPDYNARSVPCRGRMSDAMIAEAERIAKSAFLAIGGTSYGRVDLRLGADERFYVIDVNPNPDIHPEAGLSIAARSVGVDHDVLVMSLIERADHERQADSPHGPERARRDSLAHR
jgi:D-alanine-D-alanine ligase